jgi:hypothetical protein
MKTRLIALLVLWTACLWLVPAASAQLRWRVSVKFILNSSGNRPSTGIINTDEEVQTQIDNANEFLRSYGRGYQFQLTEIVDLSGVSQWYSSDRDEKSNLEAAAEADKTKYAYRDNAINIYINGNPGSAICSFPPGDDIIFMGQGSRSTSVFHESGHYFNLSHTFNGETELNSNGTVCTNGCSCAQLIGGNSDGVADTISDHTCWDTQNLISQGNYGVNYSSLSAANQLRVDNIHFNIMSYHDTRERLTSDQLDRATDASNGDRFKAASGRTRFVATTGDDVFGTGSSGSRFRTVARGVTVANSGDIVLLRNGSYDEAITITKAVTLRATRGTAIVGQ